MARRVKRYSWLVFLILGLMAVGMAVKAIRAEPEAPQARALAAPVPAGVTRTFDEADDKATATVAVGERFAVVLSSWAEWRVEAAPAILRHVETRTGPVEDTTATGADQWQVLVFEAVSPGSGELGLTLGRPWIEGDRIRDYTLAIRVTDQSGA